MNGTRNENVNLTETDSIKTNEKSPKITKLYTDFDVIKEDDEYLRTLKKSGIHSPEKINRISMIPRKVESNINKNESLTDRYNKFKLDIIVEIQTKTVI